MDRSGERARESVDFTFLEWTREGEPPSESTARSIFRGLIQPREIRQLGKPISLADLSAAARKIRLRDLAYAKICVIACWNMDASDDVPDRDLAWEIRRVYLPPPHIYPHHKTRQRQRHLPGYGRSGSDPWGPGRVAPWIPRHQVLCNKQTKTCLIHPCRN